MLTHTHLVCDLIERFSPNGIGAEIGIEQGYTSKHILTRTSTQYLYMIDPYLRDYDPAQRVYTTGRGGDPDKDYEQIVEYFAAHFPKRSTIIRKKAENATNDVPDELDFVFIDGNHTFKYVMRDLNFGVPKVKSNGLVMGHDWWGRFRGVIDAVITFCNANDVFLPPEYKLEGHVPAPSKSPVVMKSWPAGHVWWAIKK